MKIAIMSDIHGAVGHHRTQDHRAAYAVYNDVIGTIELRKVPYDVNLTCRKMQEAGLPDWLIDMMRSQSGSASAENL